MHVSAALAPRRSTTFKSPGGRQLLAPVTSMAGNERSTARELNRMSQTKYRKRMKVRAAVAQSSRIMTYITLYLVMDAAAVAATVSSLGAGQVPTSEPRALLCCHGQMHAHSGHRWPRRPGRLCCFSHCPAPSSTSSRKGDSYSAAACMCWRAVRSGATEGRVHARPAGVCVWP